VLKLNGLDKLSEDTTGIPKELSFVNKNKKNVFNY
jgi:hypothetical protein